MDDLIHSPAVGLNPPSLTGPLTSNSDIERHHVHLPTDIPASIPPTISQLLAEIKARESRIQTLTPEEFAQLIKLIHEAANQIQIANLQAEMRERHIQPSRIFSKSSAYHQQPG